MGVVTKRVSNDLAISVGVSNSLEIPAQRKTLKIEQTIIAGIKIGNN